MHTNIRRKKKKNTPNTQQQRLTSQMKSSFTISNLENKNAQILQKINHQIKLQSAEETKDHSKYYMGFPLPGCSELGRREKGSEVSAKEEEGEGEIESSKGQSAAARSANSHAVKTDGMKATQTE